MHIARVEIPTTCLRLSDDFDAGSASLSAAFRSGYRVAKIMSDFVKFEKGFSQEGGTPPSRRSFLGIDEFEEGFSMKNRPRSRLWPTDGEART